MIQLPNRSHESELRAAYGDLAAIDRLLEIKKWAHPVPSFGPAPDLIPLRHRGYLSGAHGTANAALVSGSFEDDIRAAFAARDRAFGTPDPE